MQRKPTHWLDLRGSQHYEQRAVSGPRQLRVSCDTAIDAADSPQPQPQPKHGVRGAPNEAMPQSKATIVLDTSAVLAALELIEQLYEHARAYSVDILLPVTTLVELDRIKDREKFSATGIVARKAINWINKTLTYEDVDAPVLRGQRQSETLVPGLKADDSILDCCLYNAQHRRNLTILMSDDHNLRSRALAERLETLETQSMSAGQILEAIRQRTVGFMDLDTSFEYEFSEQSEQQTHVDVPAVAAAFTGRSDEMAANVMQINAAKVAPARDTPSATSEAMEIDDNMAEVANVDTPSSKKPLGRDPELEKSRWNAPSDSRRNTHGQQQPSRNSQAKIHPEIIRPVLTPDKSQTLVENVAALVDWHLRREHPPEDLELLGYSAKPTTYRAVFKLLKTYYVPLFRYLVSRATFERAEASTRGGPQSPEFLSSWGQLLIELARRDSDYVELVANLHD